MRAVILFKMESRLSRMALSSCSAATPQLRKGRSGIDVSVLSFAGTPIWQFMNLRRKRNYVFAQGIGLCEDKFAKPPPGKRFHECYDVAQMMSSTEWNNIYQSVRRESREIGLELRK